MDANDTDTQGSDFHNFQLKHDLVNTFFHKHPGVMQSNTYQRSDNCLNYNLVMPVLIPAIK
eukprot:9299693-Ditylum_brightwellii.AAC.2